jgi:hypothetical protein
VTQKNIRLRVVFKLCEIGDTQRGRGELTPFLASVVVGSRAGRSDHRKNPLPSLQSSICGVDSGPEGVDSRPEGVDSGPEGVDSGPEGVDSGPEGVDSGTEGLDSGPQGVDSGHRGGRPANIYRAVEAPLCCLALVVVVPGMFLECSLKVIRRCVI